MSPSEYRELAATYRDAGREADADICEVMAQEAERLARYEQQQPVSIQDDDDDEPMPVMTKDEQTHQLTMF